VTPFPLLLLLWGVAMWFGLLPNRIVIFRFNPTPLLMYARRTLGLVAVVSGGLWLTLDIWLPARMTDRAGWGIVAAAGLVAAGLIAQHAAEQHSPR
jgi:hypothetical protein